MASNQLLSGTRIRGPLVIASYYRYRPELTDSRWKLPHLHLTGLKLAGTSARCFQFNASTPLGEFLPIKTSPSHLRSPQSVAELGVLKARLKQAAQGLQPAIYRRRTREAELLQELGIRVLDWADLRQSRDMMSHRFLGTGTYAQPRMAARVRS